MIVSLEDLADGLKLDGEPTQCQRDELFSRLEDLPMTARLDTGFGKASHTTAWKPLHCMIMLAQLYPVVRTFIPDWISSHDDINTVNSLGVTPIHLVATIKRVGRCNDVINNSIAEVLLRSRADPTISATDGNNLIHLVARGGNVDLMSLLISSRIDVNMLLGTRGGFTPLHYAAYGGSSAMCELLLNASANVDTRSSNGRTSLHWAVCASHRMRNLKSARGRNSIGVVRALLAAGASVHIKDDIGNTPIEYIFNCHCDDGDDCIEKKYHVNIDVLSLFIDIGAISGKIWKRLLRIALEITGHKGVLEAIVIITNAMMASRDNAPVD